MFVQFVQFETTMSETEILAIAEKRMDQFRALPGLVQKYYLKLEGENRYGGFYIWESAEAMAAFRDSDLARTIPATYGVKGRPDISIHELLFPLRPERAPAEAALTA